MTEDRQPRPRRHEGFTLLEILIVVMIIGLLMTVVATRFFGRAQEAQVTLAATQLRQLEQALELYKLDNGRYPTSDQGLEALVREPSGDPKPRRYPKGGYIEAKLLRDPWGEVFQYAAPGDHNSHSYDLYSYGPDGSEGGDGENRDITNWDEGAED